MSIVKTPLTNSQKMRLIDLFDIDEEIVEANFIEMDELTITKIEVKYQDHEESIYPRREDYDLIRNGIKLGRD